MYCTRGKRKRKHSDGGLSVVVLKPGMETPRTGNSGCSLPISVEMDSAVSLTHLCTCEPAKTASHWISTHVIGDQNPDDDIREPL